MVECVTCGFELSYGKVEKGELISCKDCGQDLEVTNINPVQVVLAPEMEEDWGE